MEKVASIVINIIAVAIAFLYPHRLSVVISRMYNVLYSRWIGVQYKGLRNIHLQKPARIVGGGNIMIKGNSYFDSHLELYAWTQFSGKKLNPSITIGEGCSFGQYNLITCSNSITIGDNVLTGRWVTITDNNHGDTTIETLLKAPLKRELVSKGGIIIGNNVWLGDKVTVLAGVIIGEGAVVASNSVVTKDVPAFSVVAGIPARIIRKEGVRTEL